MIDALDPYGFAMYKLYRESTRLVNNKTVKDLSTLNRDLGKVVCVDVNPDMYKLQEENGVQMKKFKGEKGDTELIKMMTFLEGKSLSLIHFRNCPIYDYCKQQRHSSHFEVDADNKPRRSSRCMGNA